MSKNIQLPESFVKDVYLLILALCDYELDINATAILERLETALNDKIISAEKRKAYTAYKMASGVDEREAARQKYLDLAGVHSNWRWSGETEKKGCVR